MSTISQVINKKSFKSHIVPSVVTAAVALSAAIPLTAAFASNASVAADTAPLVATKTVTADNACNVPVATTSAHTSGNVMGTSAQVVGHYYTTTVPGGNGNGNAGQGNGNGNGSSANANSNTQTNNGGLVGGVNAITPVSLLNGSLNGVLAGNAVSVPVLSNNNGNSANVPVLNNFLNTTTRIL